MIPARGRPATAAVDRFRSPPWTPDTAHWQALDAQLEPDHLARLIDRGVDHLDLTPLWQSFAGCGSKAHRPDRMLRIVLFEIQRGRTRPAQWYQDTRENIALLWLGQGIRPARSVWYTFAFRLGRYLDGFNQQVLQQVQAHGLTPATRAALDGTLVEADASRHHLLHHEQLHQRSQQLDAACQADTEGTPRPAPPYWMAHTPANRQRQQQQYATAQAHLEQRLAENRQRVPSKRLDDKQVRISVTDPEAALGKDKLKVYRPLYNVQFMRDLDSPFLLGYETFAHSSDTGTLVPLLRRTQQLTGRRPETVLVDSGYVTALDLADACQEGIDLYGPWKENDYTEAETPMKQWPKERFTWEESTRVYRCPAGQTLPLKGIQNRPRSHQRTEKLELYGGNAAVCAACPHKEQCCPKSRSGRHLTRSEHEALVESHQQKMSTPEAKALYKQRRQTVEPSFGDAKQHRNFRRINGRGLEKAKSQTALTVLAHNVWEFVKVFWGAEPREHKT